MIGHAQKLLKKYFGYSSFRKGQKKIIESILSGQDTFAIMPTGGGKSICYQIPALMLPGITLVISPLISLMKDQVDTLDSLGIPSAFINSSLSQKELQEKITSAVKGNYKLLYVAPERLESERFLELLKDMSVSLLAIDESHCVSQWGHDFRPSYRSIAPLISELPSRPVIAAFTATATEDVRNDVQRLLSLKAPNVYVTGFDRENLFFSVERGSKKQEFIRDYINTHKDQAGIIYAATRKEVDKLYETLSARNYSVGRYHAGMSDEDRSKNQEAFIYDNVQVMVATNAFGMGIDKSNVRYVIHLNMPRNMESYYQEAGRAGRDGDPAECILLYSASDVHVQKYLIEQTLLSPDRKSNEYKKLQGMIDYSHTSQCLRKFILEYFGEEEVQESCGNCSTCNDTSELSDITLEAQKIFSCIKRMGEQYGVSLTANVLRGSNTKKINQLGFNSLSTYGIMKNYTLNELTALINLMAAEDYLVITEGQYPVVKLGRGAIPVLQGKERVLRKIQKKVQVVEDASPTLFDLLRSVRKEISEAEKVPPYVIFHDSTLKEMAKYFPVDRQSMLTIPGVGENKFNKYGSRFIEAIAKYMDENQIIQHDVKSQPEASRESKEPKVPSHLITYDMYKDGKSPEEIALERNLTIVSVEGHLSRCHQEGYSVDWDTFIPSQHEELICQTIEKLGAERLKPIKDELPDEISYFNIRAVICKHFTDRVS